VRNNPINFNDPSGLDADCGFLNISSCRRQVNQEYADSVLRTVTQEKQPTTWNNLTSSQQKYLQNVGLNQQIWDKTDFALPNKDVSWSLEDPFNQVYWTIVGGKIVVSAIPYVWGYLNPGGGYVVYRYIKDGVTLYVGITGDFARRSYEHLSQRGWNVFPIEGLDDLTYLEARGVEQALIEYHGLANLINKINSISPSNPIYPEAVQQGVEILKALGIIN
jgi:hypothetical protein